ncbi:hypothetical protein HDU97_000018 [Phlyctochytrium planicorne]|nr:hypothetical protein HDU97_000018 [Phlyctochytrium planicorne]
MANSLPFYKSLSSDKYRRGTWSALIARYIKAIINDPKTKNVFFFLLLNLVFTVVEFVWGWWTNSLGLISDAVHMLFDSTALILSLIASVIVKWEATDSFTYGYGRVETLTGFANALALVFASLGIIWEGLERLWDPPEIKMDNLLLSESLPLITEVWDTITDMEVTTMEEGSCRFSGDTATAMVEEDMEDMVDTTRSLSEAVMTMGMEVMEAMAGMIMGDTVDTIMEGMGITGTEDMGITVGMLGMEGMGVMIMEMGMFLHVLADTLGSVGVIISCILINLYGWTWADPFASLFIAVLILGSIWPLLVESTCVLLQRIPQSILGKTAEAFRRLQLVEGVVGFSQPHFWEICHGKNVGSIKIQVREGTNMDRTRIQVVGLFREYDIHDMVVQIEQDVVVGY